MAEFCLRCWNELQNTTDSPRRYVLSRSLEFCEGCGQFRKIILTERLWSRIQRHLTGDRINTKPRQ